MINHVKKIISIVLSITLLMPLICFGLRAYDGLDANEDKTTFESLAELSEDVNVIYSNKQIIMYEDFKISNEKIKDGLTILYGANIELNAEDFITHFNTGVSEKNIVEHKDSQLMLKDPMSNTYMILCMKQGERMDIEYISVSYAPGVDKNTIQTFVDNEITYSCIDARVKSFIVDQFVRSDSAYHERDKNNRSSSSTTIVQTVRDTNYYIANYTTNTGSVYPLMIYKKDITYTVTLLANTLEDEDLYVITATVNVIPGNAMESYEANNYASMSGLYNSTYGNVIAIKGLRTIFENMYPEYDYFIDMSPRYSLQDVSNETISISLGVPISVSLSYNVNFGDSGRIDMDAVFNPYGQSSVKFEAFRQMVIMPNLVGDVLYYVAGVYMSSGGSVLSMRVATDVLYYFQTPRAEETAVWSGSARDIYYENIQ